MLHFIKSFCLLLCLVFSQFISAETVNDKESPIHNETLSRHSATKPLEKARICLICLKGKKIGGEFVSSLKKLGADVIVFSPTHAMDPYGLYEFEVHNAEKGPTPITFNENSLETLKKFKPNFLIDASGNGTLFNYISNSDSTLLEQISLTLVYDSQIENSITQLEEVHQSFPPVIDYFKNRTRGYFADEAALIIERVIRRNVDDDFRNKKVAIIGYGHAGKGCAEVFREKNMDVIIVENDAKNQLRAYRNGFKVASKKEALKGADLVISLTGAPSVVSTVDLENLNDHAILFTLGYQGEFDFEGIKYLKTERLNELVDEHTLSNHKRIRVFAKGTTANSFPEKSEYLPHDQDRNISLFLLLSIHGWKLRETLHRNTLYEVVGPADDEYAEIELKLAGISEKI